MFLRSVQHIEEKNAFQKGDESTFQCRTVLFHRSSLHRRNLFKWLLESVEGVDVNPTFIFREHVSHRFPNLCHIVRFLLHWMNEPRVV